MVASRGVLTLVFALAVGATLLSDRGVMAAAPSQPSAVKGGQVAPAAPSYVADLVETARKLLARDERDASEIAVRMLNQAVQAGDADAMLLLGGMYGRGDKIARDGPRAERLLRAALLAGKVKEASFALGNLYEDPGPSRNLPQAVIAYEAAIALDHVEARVRLARIILSGAGGSLDLGEARRLLESAIAAGAAASAGETLGDLHLQPGPARNPSEAANDYRLAAEAGNGAAMVKLAAMLATGNGVGIDVKRAEQLLKQAVAAGAAAAAWAGLGDLYRVDSELRSDAKSLAAYKTAAALGDGGAMVRLAALLSGGKPESRDLPQARKLLEAAVAAGNARNAGLALGDLLRTDGPMRDLAVAATAYAAAVAAGNTAAMMRLARMYAAGEGVEVDRVKAAALLTQAIDGGEGRDAYEMLGDVYADSHAPDDSAKAAEAFRRAVALGSRSATPKLARLIAFGDRVSADPARARKMLEDAIADDATGEAWRALADIYRMPGTGFTDNQQALRAYDEAAKRGDAEAMFQIGAMLSDGKSVPPDFERAIEMYAQAIALGDVAKAGEALGKLYLGYPKGQPDLAAAGKYLEMAAAAGSGPAHLEAATLIQGAYRNAAQRRTIVDHFKAAARILTPQRVALEMMRLSTPVLLSAAQQLLVDSGQPLSIDGKFGQPTSAAIAGFCDGKGIKTCEKNFITIQLLEALLTQ